MIEPREKFRLRKISNEGRITFLAASVFSKTAKAFSKTASPFVLTASAFVLTGSTLVLTGCASGANDKNPKVQNTETEVNIERRSDSKDSTDSSGNKITSSKSKKDAKSHIGKIGNTDSPTVPSPRTILNNLKEVKEIENPYGYYPKPKTAKEIEAGKLILEALKLVESGNYNKAQELAERSKAIAPDYARVWNLIGTLEFSKSQFAKAGNAFYKACKLDTNYAAAWVNLSSVYLELDRKTAAAIVYRHLLKLAPNESSSWAMMGGVYTKLEKGTKAEECYKKALSLDPKNAEAWYHLGYCYHCQKKYKEAEESYKKSLKLNPENQIAWYYLSLTQACLNKPKEAEASKKKMESLGSTSLIASTGKITERKSSQLEAFYQNSIKLNPKDTSGYTNLATLYFSQSKFQKALPYLEKANSFKPNDPKIVNMLASSMMLAGDSKAAIKLLTKSLEKNKRDYSNTILLAYIYNNLRDYKNAEKFARLAVKIEPQSETAWTLICTSLVPQNRYEEEVIAAKRLISLNPKISSNIWCILVDGLIKQKKFDEANKALAKASLLYPNDYRVLKHYGLYYGLQNNIDKAEYYFKKAVIVNPEGGKSWYQLASVYKAKGEQANYANALVKTAMAHNDTLGIDFKELANKLNAIGKSKEATLALKNFQDSTPDDREWMSLTHTPGQDRHFPVSIRGVD